MAKNQKKSLNNRHVQLSNFRSLCICNDGYFAPYDLWRWLSCFLSTCQLHIQSRGAAW